MQRRERKKRKKADIHINIYIMGRNHTRITTTECKECSSVPTLSPLHHPYIIKPRLKQVLGMKCKKKKKRKKKMRITTGIACFPPSV